MPTTLQLVRARLAGRAAQETSRPYEHDEEQFVAKAIHGVVDLSRKQRRLNQTPSVVRNRLAVLAGRQVAGSLGLRHHNRLIGSQLEQYNIPNARENVHGLLTQRSHPALFGNAYARAASA